MGGIYPKWSLTLLPLVCLTGHRASAATHPLAVSATLETTPDAQFPDAEASKGAEPRFTPNIQYIQPDASLDLKFTPTEGARPKAAVPVLSIPAPDAGPGLVAQAIVPTADNTQTQVVIDGNVTTITGGTQVNDNLFHRFDRFNVDAGQVADFVTQSNTESVIGQIAGSGVSYINGLLQVSGSSADLYLINPAGIVFGSDARLNLSGSFTATTAERMGFGEVWLSPTLTQDYGQFTQTPDALALSSTHPGVIINQGDLAVGESQSLRLVGGEIANTGHLSASGGEISLVAASDGQLVRLGQAGSLLNLEVDPARLTSPQATPEQPTRWVESLPAWLTGGSTEGATALIVNADGSVTLTGAEATLTPTSGMVIASGSLDVSGVAGGQVTVLGEHIHGIDMTVNASGLEAGGTVRIGGDYQGRGTGVYARQVEIDADSKIYADALEQGNGGQVIVWGEDTVRFSGGISARGGDNGGHGGLVETSGQQRLQVQASAQVDTSAPAGEAGMWLLDPVNFAIANSGGDITPATLIANLQNTSLTLNAINLLTVTDGVDASGNTAPMGAGNLTLDAPTIDMNARITLQPGRTLSGTATTVNIGPNGSIQNGVDVVATGGTVNLAATTYRESAEVLIDRSLTLQGQGSGQTIVSGDVNSDGIGDHRVFNVTGGTVALNHLTIQSGQSVAGGGINNTANLSINNSVIANNIAQDGGGINNSGGQLSISNSQIINNQATATDPAMTTAIHGGGGIRNLDGGLLTLSQSQVSNNTSANLGGGILNVSTGSVTTAQISQSTLSGNQAATRGGGIESARQGGINTDSVLSMTDSTVSGNTAGINGGGVRVVGVTTLRNVTITNNSSGVSGGGLSDNTTTNPLPSMINTIIAGNTALSSPDVEGLITDLGNNLIGVADASNGFTASTLVGTATNPINPLLSPLGLYGGPTATHLLLNGSPAINAGNNAGTSSVDQRGVARIIEDTVDIGAVEVVPPTALTASSGSSALPSIPDLRLDADTVNSSALKDLIDRIDYFHQPQESVLGELNFQLLEKAFTSDYVEFWQLPLNQETTLASAQDILQQAEDSYGTRSSIIYATFVSANATSVDEASITQSLMHRESENDQDRLLLYMVPPNGEPIQRLVDVTRQEVLQQIKLFRIAVSDPEDEISYRPLARQVYGWLLEPLKPDLQRLGINNLLYALDTGLRTTPLAAMMEGDDFVIERYGLSIIPSAGLLQAEFGEEQPIQETLAAGANEFAQLEALPAVPIELAMIAASSPHADILLNESFTIGNLVSTQAKGNSEAIHLATHAQFNPGSPDSSYIQFWDDQLTFSDMKALNWQDLELLILSACSTALSSPDAELGFAGLAAATGVETTIGSLWNVSDIGTLALMAEFYGQLTTTPLRFAALRNAQLSLLKQNTRIENQQLFTQHLDLTLPEEFAADSPETFEHPFYWSSFTLVGNPWW